MSIAKIISFAKSVKRGISIGIGKTDDGTEIKNAENYQPSCEDAAPLAGDYCVSIVGSETGSRVIIAYLDPKNAGDVNTGEKKIYSRNSTGTIVCSVYLKNDGTIEIKSDSDIDINGATITALGDVVSATGISLSNHTHPQANDSGGNVEQPTMVPTP